MLGKTETTGEVGGKGWGGWTESLTQWTRVWANSRWQWRTGGPGLLQSMRSWRVEHDLVTEQQQVQGESWISQRESCLSVIVSEVRGSWPHFLSSKHILAPLRSCSRITFSIFPSPCCVCNTTTLRSLSQEMTIGCRNPYKLIGYDSLKEQIFCREESFYLDSCIFDPFLKSLLA